MPTTVVSWNIAKRHEPWRQLLQMDADIALLQEAGSPPPDVADRVGTGPAEHWDSHIWNSRWYEGRFDNLYDRWPMVVKLSDRVEVEWFKQVSPISETREDEIAVSGIGTVAAARIIPKDAAPFIVVSMYARWIKPHPLANSAWRVGYQDGSAHRIISDLSAFIGSTDPSTHRILAAGDLNMIYGATDDNRLALPARDRTVTDRMDALGMEFLGPWHPAGRLACPTPQGLPPYTLNVPTYHTTRQSSATAQNQLDYVFASRGFHRGVTVRAMNSVDEWGASDHCRLSIEVAGRLPERQDPMAGHTGLRDDSHAHVTSPGDRTIYDIHKLDEGPTSIVGQIVLERNTMRFYTSDPEVRAALCQVADDGHAMAEHCVVTENARARVRRPVKIGANEFVSALRYNLTRVGVVRLVAKTEQERTNAD